MLARKCCIWDDLKFCTYIQRENENHDAHKNPYYLNQRQAMPARTKQNSFLLPFATKLSSADARRLTEIITLKSQSRSEAVRDAVLMYIDFHDQQMKAASQ